MPFLLSLLAFVTPTPAPTTLPTPNVAIHAPVASATISGDVTLIASAVGWETRDYLMYWQVDGGELHPMSDAAEGKKTDVVDVDNWGSGVHGVTVIAKVKSGRVVYRDTISVTVTTSNVFAGRTLYVDPFSDAAEQVATWMSTRPDDAYLMSSISTQSTAIWFGDWYSDIRASVDQEVSEVTAAGDLPVLVAYNIANRDCGGHSSGGVATYTDYATWIRDVAAGIGDRAAVVILEPDALAHTDCQSAGRSSAIADAVLVLSALPQVAVYVDAGHPGWNDATTMASRLRGAGIANADGFSLNVANFRSTDENIAYGEALSAMLDGKHFVIDVGRNGNGEVTAWCNPPDAALGQNPTTDTDHEFLDALLWIKQPGESDGTCNGGLPGGDWMPEYALTLLRNAM